MDERKMFLDDECGKWTERTIKQKDTLLEEMVLFRTRNGSIPCFIYGTPKWFYIEPFFW